MLSWRKSLVLAAVAASFTAVPLCLGQARAAARHAAVGGNTVNIPYTVLDNQGNQWMIYQYGQIQQQGNMPIYSGGAMLQINGAYPQVRGNQARLDDKTGEVVMENLPFANNTIQLTRRILINKEEGWVRYIDIIRNPGRADVTPNINLMTNLNYGIQMANNVPDPKRAGQNIGWVAQTHANGRCVFEMIAGKGAKVAPSINHQQGNNQVSFVLAPTIGAGKEVALMHFHGLVNTLDQGTKWITNLKESKVMAGIPAAIRKLIVNFRGGENFIGDYEILRGEVLDVVELRGGDQLKGTLKPQSYKLQAFYGAVELPVDKVIGLINIGEFRPRQLLVTRDGEIFGGSLAGDKIALELSSGQITEIPLAQITRMGYRKGSDEPEEWTFEKPLVLMRSGDRMLVQMPAEPIAVVTRYGQLQLKPEAIAAIDFQTEEHGRVAPAARCTSAT